MQTDRGCLFQYAILKGLLLISRSFFSNLAMTMLERVTAVYHGKFMAHYASEFNYNVSTVVCKREGSMISNVVCIGCHIINVIINTRDNKNYNLSRKNDKTHK